MPVDGSTLAEIYGQLEKVSKGQKVGPIDIGLLTQKQFADINAYRSRAGLPSLESAVIVYVGCHRYRSRLADGYSIPDMVMQLCSGLDAGAVVIASRKMTALQNPLRRNDGYGNAVRDTVVLELTARKPKAEAFSAIPKGDKIPPGGDITPSENTKPLN